MSVTADTLDSRLRKRSSSSRRTSRVSSIASGISRRLSRVSGKSVTTDNPLFVNEDDLFTEQDVLCSRFLSTQDITCTSAPNGCNPPDALRQPSRYGIRLRVLQRIRDQLDQLPTKDGHVWSCTTVYKLLKTFTASQQCSFTTLLQQYEADTQHPFAGGNTNDVSDAANVYVAQAWEIPFNVLVESLECFMENNNKDHNTTYFYVSGISLNLHAELDKEEYMNGLWTCIGNYQDVVFVVDRWLDPVSFTRLWCLWELVAGIESETTNVTLQLSKSESERFRAELSKDIEVILDNFFSVNAETAITSSDVHNKLINDHIRESISKEKIGMNQRIMKLLRGWLVDICKAELEQSRVQDAQSDRTVQLMNNLGVLLLRESKMKEAEALYREGLQIREDTLDAVHPDIATSCGLLGTLTFELAKFEESEQLLRRALAIRENPIAGCSELEIAQSCINLGILLLKLSRIPEAEELSQRALNSKTVEELCENNESQYVNCVLFHGKVLEKQGNWSEAAQVFRKVISLHPNIHQPTQQEVVIAYNDLAFNLHKIRQNTEALEYADRALRLSEQLFDHSHVQVANCCHIYGTVQNSQNNASKSEKLLLRALAIRKSKLGKSHPSYGVTCNNISVVYNKRFQYSLSRNYLKKALKCYMIAYGERSSSVSMAYNNLGVTYRNTGNAGKATLLYRKAVGIAKDVFGLKHQTTAKYLANYVQSFSDRTSEEYIAALKDLFTAYVLLSDNDDDKEVTLTLQKLVTSLRHIGKYCEAEKYCKEAVLSYKSGTLQSEAVAFQCFVDLGEIQSLIGKIEEAAQSFRDAFKISRDDFPSKLPQLLKSSTDVFIKLERLEEVEQMIQDAIELNQGDRELSLCLGTVLEAKGDLEGAYVAYCKARQGVPIRLVKLLIKRGMFQDAIKLVNDTLENLGHFTAYIRIDYKEVSEFQNLSRLVKELVSNGDDDA